jgi:hypothetical protein
MAFDFPSSPIVGQQFTPIAGTTYTWNGYGWILTTAAGTAIAVNIRKFTASETYFPSANLVSAIIECIAGGGGGAGTVGAAGYYYWGASGGSGSYSRSCLTAVQIGASQTITIGPGGNGGAAGTNSGTAGGDTSFGLLCVAKGGGPGIAGSPGDGGTGGVPGTGDIVAAGNHGSNGGYSYQASGTGATATTPVSAPSALGGAVAATIAIGSNTGITGGNYGAGGSGGVCARTGVSAAGAFGGPGICIVTEFIGVALVQSASQASSLVYLTTLTANNVANLDWTGITSDYDDYVFELINILPSAANSWLLMRLQVAGAFQTTNYLGQIAGGFAAGSLSPSGGMASETATGGFELSGSGTYFWASGTAAGEGVCGEVNLVSPNNTTGYKYISGTTTWLGNTQAIAVAAVVGGCYKGIGAATGVRFLFNTGNIVSGAIRIWGKRSSAGVGAPSAFTVGGRLSYVSATALSFTPFNGSYTIINGAALPIPVAGIAGLGNTGVYVNGVAGQNLAANTSYYVYEFSNAGIITADFSTTTHATSSTPGNAGTEIKSGDDTRSLIGLIRTNASSQFADTAAQRFVISWFNRRNIGGKNTFDVAHTTTSTVVIEIHSSIRTEFLTWGDEAVHGAIGGCMHISIVSTSSAGYAFDGTTTERQMTAHTSGGAAWRGDIACSGVAILSEGYHYITLIGATNGGTVTYTNVDDNANGICRTHVMVRG